MFLLYIVLYSVPSLYNLLSNLSVCGICVDMKIKVIKRRHVFVHNIYFTESLFKAFISFAKTQFAN